MKYMSHCAEFIQKCWRGYYGRNYIIPVVTDAIYRNRILKQYTRGWKVRRILSGCEDVIELRKELSGL